MTEEELTAHARAAETKKRRTRDKLIHAADFVMREDGWEARVETIAEEAGVSSPTFYNTFKSRNAVCSAAVESLVLDQLDLLGGIDTLRYLQALSSLTLERQDLVRAALVARLEAGITHGGLKVEPTFLGPFVANVSGQADIVERLARGLYYSTATGTMVHEDRNLVGLDFAMRALALMMFDLIAAGKANELMTYVAIVERLGAQATI